MIVEICANSFESAVAAQHAGADRVELCVELSVGGITPSHGLIEKVIDELNIPVHVLIRPRSGNFYYSETELDVMIKDILYCKNAGCAGVVSGVLTAENDIDEFATKKLINASEGMEFTFHRAFDWCREPQKAFDSLLRLQVSRLLSSGQQPKAIDGIELLKTLKNASEGTIEIMPGGGIIIENVMAFKVARFTSVHLSATRKVQTLKQPPKVSMHSMSFSEEGIVATSSEEIIQQVIQKLA